MTVQHVYDFINGIAPFETQVTYDNSGLLVGSAEQEVTGVIFALDVTDRVIDSALAQGCNLIVTHHPMMFSPIKRVLESEHEGRLLCRMIRSGMSLIAAHTNLDQAPGGVNDVLGQAIGLVNLTGEGFVRVGDLPRPMTAGELAAHIGARLGDVVRVTGEDRTVTRVGLCSGSGSDEWRAAFAMGAQAFLTGEAKHHHTLEADAFGVTILEAGHYATEAPGIFSLANALQTHLNDVKCNVRVFCALNERYRAAYHGGEYQQA